jgi:hypothetical protein
MLEVAERQPTVSTRRVAVRRSISLAESESQSQSESESCVTTDRQPASLSWNKAPIWGLRPDLYYLCDIYGLVLLGRPLWREVGFLFCMCYWPLPAQSFSGPSTLRLETIFHCVRFETSLFVASYDLQGHGGGIRPRLHTGCLPWFWMPYIKRATLLSLSHSIFERAGTTRRTCKTRNLQQSAKDYFYRRLNISKDSNLCECLICPRILLARVRWRVCLHFLQTHLSRLLVSMPLSARLHTWFQLDGVPPDYSRRVRH